MEEYRKNVNIQIGKRLKEARENLGRTQAEIAVSFGISDEYYRKYESGATGLSADKLLILYKEYGIYLMKMQPKWLKYCMSMKATKNQSRNWVIKMLLSPKPQLESNQYWC